MHEARCLDTIQKKLASAQDGAAKPLQAYGAVADQRWSELLALVEADDASAAGGDAPPKLGTCVCM
mgnify:CR=1 FL=1